MILQQFFVAWDNSASNIDKLSRLTKVRTIKEKKKMLYLFL